MTDTHLVGDWVGPATRERPGPWPMPQGGNDVPNGTCSIDGCDKPVHVKAKGWCVKHYTRWYRHGDPLHERPTFAERFWSYVEKGDGCWRWTGGVGRSGYGVFTWHEAGGRRSDSAHRLAYQMSVGPIPDGLHLDHVAKRGCTSKACVNPAHLEAVTPLENHRRWRETFANAEREEAAFARTGPN